MSRFELLQSACQLPMAERFLLAQAILESIDGVQQMSALALGEQQHKKQSIDDLFAAMQRMGQVQEPTQLSAEQVAQEIALMRSERRGQQSH